MWYSRVAFVASALLLLTIAAGRSPTDISAAQSQADVDVEMSPISGDFAKPRRHFRLRRAADLNHEEASRIYRIVRETLRTGYSGSGQVSAETYQMWQRYNTAPFRSATHGNHYVNVYANPVAKAYAAFEQAGMFPVGSIIAKDSFAVASSGEILLGPLFIMEKMPAGFNYVSDDWRYVHIQPDGTFFGETNGVNSERVEHCAACHLAAAHQNHLFFIPGPFRVDFGN